MRIYIEQAKLKISRYPDRRLAVQIRLKEVDQDDNS